MADIDALMIPTFIITYMLTNEFKDWIDADIKPPTPFRCYTFYAKRLYWTNPVYEVIFGFYNGEYACRTLTTQQVKYSPYIAIAYKESEVQQYLEPFE